MAGQSLRGGGGDKTEDEARRGRATGPGGQARVLCSSSGNRPTMRRGGEAGGRLQTRIIMTRARRQARTRMREALGEVVQRGVMRWGE